MSEPGPHRRVALKGAVIMLASAFLFAVVDGLIKTLGPAFQAWDIAFYRFGGGLVILAVLFFRQGNPFRGKHLKLLIIRGLTGSVAFLTLVTAIQLVPLSTAIVLFYSFPAFTAIFATLFFGERLFKGELICIAATIAGIAILFNFRLEGQFVGQVLAVVAGISAGLTVCLIKKLRGDNGPVVIYLYFCLIGALVSLPGFLTDPRLPEDMVEGTMVAGIILASIAAQLLMNQGFKYCRSWEGGVYLTFEVLFTSIFAIMVLGDPVTWRFGLGGAIIFLSVIALNSFKSRDIS